MNRFAPVLFAMLLSIPVPPVLVYLAVSSGYVSPGWLPVSLAVSFIVAITCIVFIKRNWLDPLNLMIERLYGRRDPERTAAKALNEIERAISFRLASERTQETSETEQLHGSLNRLKEKQAVENSLIEEQTMRLEAALEEVEDEKIHLQSIRHLTNPALRNLIGAYNRGGDSAVLDQLADKITFLLSENPSKPRRSTENVRDLIDSTLDALSPFLENSDNRFHLILDNECPATVEIASLSFRLTLLRLILAHLASSEASDITIEVKHDPDSLVLGFTPEFRPRIAIGLDELITSNRAQWRDNQFRFPVGFEDNRIMPATDCGLTALIISDSDAERLSLVQRLTILGVSCTSDFKSEQLDMCLVSNESSDTFLSVRPYLPDTAYVLLLNQQNVINRPYWLQLGNPLTQTRLASIVEHIGHAKDESRQIRALTVDDSRANAKLLTLQLRELGHTVTNAASGQEAIDCVEKESYQIIFMDIQMPDMSGVEATRRIRALGSKMPIFGLTAHATSQEKETYREAGMDDVLIKPVRMDNLKSILRRLGRFTPLPPIQAPASQASLIFDKELSLINANHRPELAAELIDLLVKSLPDDQKIINESRDDVIALKKTVHKLHGAVRYCGVPRLAKAIEKFESALKQNDSDQLPLLLNLLNGEITALEGWYRENHDVFGLRGTTES